MATKAMVGWGTILKIGDGATAETFNTILEALSISGPSFSAGFLDVTNADSASNAREKIGEALVDGGQVTLEGNYVPTDTYDKQVITDMYAGTTRNFELIFTDSGASKIAFAAIITGFEPGGMEEGSAVSKTITLEVTGKPTTP